MGVDLLYLFVTYMHYVSNTSLLFPRQFHAV